MKQFTILEATQNFSLKQKHGRPVVVSIGDQFYVTNPEHMQDVGIKVMRKKNARLNEGYLIDCNQVNQIFKILES